MSSEPSTQPRIAIIGGGLGGLALLLTLHRRGVPATVYERDIGFDARAHLGASLDLGWTSGQRALRENGLQEDFDKHSRPEGDQKKIYDGTGKLHVHVGAESADGPQDSRPPQGREDRRPEIGRSVLRKILLDAVPADLIKWDHALSSVRPLGDGQHELTFANGFSTTCDFLVGADGANSRVRPLVSPATPTYTGVTFVEVSLTPETTKLPELAETIANIGQGAMLAMQNSRMLGSQINADGGVRTFVIVRESASWSLPSSRALAEIKAALQAHFTGWPQWMLNLIDHADPRANAIYPRPLSVLPAGHSWAHARGVTLVGDAAHLMTPFMGAGANLALLDGLELGLALADLWQKRKLGDAGGVDQAVGAFEEKMCAMAGRLARMANENLDVFVGPDTPQSAIARFRAVAAEGEREG